MNYQNGYVAQTVEQKRAFAPNIVNFGAHNCEPQIVGDAVMNCGLATACVDVLAGFLSGDGFVSEINDIVCNERGETLNDILNFVSEQAAIFNGFALHFDYNPFLQIVAINPVEYQFARKSYPYGKIAIWDNWAGESPDFYSTIANISYFDEYKHGQGFRDISAKFQSFEDWKGQIAHFGYKKGALTYATATVRPVLKDVMSFATQANFRYRAAKNNFSASKIIEYIGTMDDKERQAVQAAVSNFMGDENAGSVMVLPGGYRDENGNFQSSYHIHDTDIQSVDRLFDVQHGQIQQNIMNAFRIPMELFSLNGNKGLNSSAEMLKSAYNTFNNFTHKQRNWVASELSPILSSFLGYKESAEIKPLKYNIYE